VFYQQACAKRNHVGIVFSLLSGLKIASINAKFGTVERTKFIPKNLILAILGL